MQVITADLPASYAAEIPFHVPAGLRGPHYLLLRGRALYGRIGVGVLETVDGKRSYPLQEKYLTPAMGLTDLYIPLLNPKRADTLILTNAVEDHVRSKIVVEDAALVAVSKPPAERVIQALDPEHVKTVDSRTQLGRGTVGLMLIAGTRPSSPAARLPLPVIAAEGLTLRVRLRVLKGNLAFAIADSHGAALSPQRSVWASQRQTEVVLPLPSKPPLGDLVISNSAGGAAPSQAVIEKIGIHKANER
jgi:hypothetical protein